MAIKKQRPVARGETLSLIAAQEGVSVDDLKKANALTGDTIYLGQRLKIPITTVSTSAPSSKPTQTQTSDLVGLRKTATDMGYDVTAQGATPFVSGKQVDTTGLQNIGGSWMGTPDIVNQKIQSITSKPQNLVYDENTDTMVDTVTNKVVQTNVKRGQQPSEGMSFDDLKRIMNEVASKYQPTIQTLTRNEAEERAKTLLNPQYEQAAKDIETRLQLGGVMSGFGGQPVGTSALADALAKNEYQKAQAINQTAEQLYGQSKAESAAAESTASQRRQQEIANMLNALSLSQQSQTANRTFALEKAKFMSDEEQRNFQNSILNRKTKLDEAAFELDKKLKEGQITAQDAQTILAIKKQNFDQEMAGKELDLKDRQLKNDEATRAAQISSDWARIGVQREQLAWEQNPNNPANLLTMSKITSEPDYDYTKDTDWQEAYTMAINPNTQGQLYAALQDPISQQKFLAKYGYKGFNALLNLVKPKQNTMEDVLRSFGIQP